MPELPATVDEETGVETPADVGRELDELMELEERPGELTPGPVEEAIIDGPVACKDEPDEVVGIADDKMLLLKADDSLLDDTADTLDI